MESFLTDKFGESHGKDIYKKTQNRLKRLLANTQGKSKTQTKTLRNTILPRVALYQVLQDEMSKDEAYRVVKEYLTTVVCAKMKKQYLQIEKLPLFPKIFQRLFISTVLKSDLWKAECVKDDKTGFQVNIHHCLWQDACVENGCPELTRAFCECDDINYGSLHKIRFSRTGSIGMGAEQCDFHFDRVK